MTDLFNTSMEMHFEKKIKNRTSKGPINLVNLPCRNLLEFMGSLDVPFLNFLKNYFHMSWNISFSYFYICEME